MNAYDNLSKRRLHKVKWRRIKREIEKELAPVEESLHSIARIFAEQLSTLLIGSLFDDNILGADVIEEKG